MRNMGKAIAESEYRNVSITNGEEESAEWKSFRDLWIEEDGMGTVEVVLIIVVLVGLVVIFKSQITTIIQGLFKKITSQTDKL